MASDNDSVDWSKYPLDRVEGLKYFFKGPSSDEDGPCTEEELKMLCVKWDCKVDMKIDNFLYWLMRKTKEKNFNGNHELFVSNMPRMISALRKKGLEKYEKYQEDYGEMNRKYLAYCADWRRLELRRLRWLNKFNAFRATWSSDDSEDEEESDSDDESDKVFKVGDTDASSDSSGMATVIETRYNSYPETESVDFNIDNVEREEEVDQDIADDDIDDVNTQLFAPESTSTQQDK